MCIRDSQRLGVCGNFSDPYTTMTFAAEASIVNEMGKFLLNGSLYRGSKPVMWSVVEKTALAEAEIEYEDHKSTTIYAKFLVKEAKLDVIKDANIIIWTPTPWTMPGNRAVAFSTEFNYSLIKIKVTDEQSLAQVDNKIIIAKDLIEEVTKNCKILEWEELLEIKGKDFKDVILHHPLSESGYRHEVKMLPADFVTVDQGTGFVHIAPGHGEDDYFLGKKFNIEVPETLAGNGNLLDHLPLISAFRNRFEFDIF